METKLNINAVPPPAGPAPTPAAPAPPIGSVMQNDPADMRLVIEPDPQVGGGYVYKTIDRRTGTVVLELPRTEVVQLPAAADYTAGSVVKAKA